MENLIAEQEASFSLSEQRIESYRAQRGFGKRRGTVNLGRIFLEKALFGLEK